MMLLINRDDTIQWRYGFLQWLVGMMYWFEESENILADDLLVQYVHFCALKKEQCIGLGRILYTNENDVTCYHLLCNMSASVTRWDRILYNYMSWFHIWICSSIVQHCEQSIHSLFPIPILHVMKSYDIFARFHVCKQIFSTYYKWFLVELLFNIFIFKLLVFDIDVHLCFYYTVLIYC